MPRSRSTRAFRANRDRFARTALIAGYLLGFTAPGPLALAGDDWSLERSAADPTLVSQRLARLRRNPFDQAQWKAVVREVGAPGVADRIETALLRSPDDLALLILDARATLLLGDGAGAARKLAAIEPNAGRWKDKVVLLRVSALEASGRVDLAIEALEQSSEHDEMSADERVRRLNRAFEHADQAGRHADTLRLAQKLVDLRPSPATQLRLARAASSAGEHRTAEQNYLELTRAARGNTDELLAEHASARLLGDDATGAAALLWSLLESPRRGTSISRATWWARLVEAHRRSGAMEPLVEHLERWLEQHPDESAAWKALAHAQHALGIDATAAWRMAVRQDPRDVEAHVELIETLEAHSEINEAVAALSQLLAREPSEIQVGLDLAARLIAAGDQALGMRVASDIRTRVGRHPRSLMLLLDFYNLNDESDSALEVANRLVELHPNDPDVRIALGEQLYQMGRSNEAIDQWTTLPRLIRPAHRGWLRHAEVLAEHGRTTEAVTSVKKAIKLSPTEPAYLRLRAVLAEEQRRPAQALLLWEQVRAEATALDQKLLRDEARTRVVELLVGGAIQKRRAQLTQARTDARSLLDAGEPLAEALEAGRFLAELHTRGEDYAAAVGVQQRLLALFPDDPDRLEELASAQRRAGQLESALETLEDLMALEPTRMPVVLAEMSELAFEAGNDERALTAATTAARRDSDQVEAIVRLGELYERRGDTHRAAAAYARAIDTTPRDQRARIRLAELELTRGETQRAASLLRDVLDHGGPPELLRDAGKRALDLAEASNTLPELLTLAVGRTTRHPDAEEPREFLLEALDRIDPDVTRGWLAEPGVSDDDVTGRRTALRTPLLAALAQGPVRVRLRAAEHLGRLDLPNSAVPLIHLGASMNAPRDSTQTVRDAYQMARLTAVRAAGRLRDPQAIPAFVGLMLDPAQSSDVRRTAAWALSLSGTADGVRALADQLGRIHDVQPEIATIACIAIAEHSPVEIDPEHASWVATLAHRNTADDPEQRRLQTVCAFAEAALTTDRDLDRVRTRLLSCDDELAAIAAWRLGQSRASDTETIEALYTRLLGANGTARDASASALAHLLRSETQPPRASASVVIPPPGTSSSEWGTQVDRWLRDQVAPRYVVLSPSDVFGTLRELRQAMEAAQRGTRAERAAVAQAERECFGAPIQRGSVCLAPLVSGPVLLDSTSDPKRIR